MILDPADIRRVLVHSPEPFATDSPGKRAALAHFESKNVLVSRGPERTERRDFKEEVLDTDRPVHHFGESFRRIVGSETARLYDHLLPGTQLTWERFADAANFLEIL